MTNKVGFTELSKFSKFFRQELRDPFIQKILTKATPEQINTLNHVLPTLIQSKITKLEDAPNATSIQKSNWLSEFTFAQLERIGLTILWPWVSKWLQDLVILQYKEHFLAKFKEWGADDYVEKLVNKDLDSDGDIGGVPIATTLEEPKVVEPI